MSEADETTNGVTRATLIEGARQESEAKGPYVGTPDRDDAERPISTTPEVPALWQATPSDLAILKASLVDDKVTDREFAFFITAARHMNLDPFKRQVHLVKYGGRPTLQTGIDGYRALAVRTGKLDGQDEPIWIHKAEVDGKIVLTAYGPKFEGREVWPFDRKTPPFAAIATVWRKGVARKFTYVAQYDSYVRRRSDDGSPMALWATMPEVMLFKCAMAQALRAAFPDELAGIYTVEEMEQAANEQRAPEVKAGLTKEQHAAILDAIKRADEGDKLRVVEWLRARGFTGETQPETIKGKPASPGLRVLNDFSARVTREDEIGSVIAMLKGGDPIIDEPASFDVAMPEAVVTPPTDVQADSDKKARR